MSGLPDRLADLRVVVCAGAGGVGKTTVAASLALGLAAQGRRVALVTIDPARRLAEALGLDDLGNDPQQVNTEPFAQAGLDVTGELSAMMLNVKRTFDELVARLAPDQATAQQILANPIYDHISRAAAGSQEYTAMAKLFEINRREEYEVIVLDTPPSRSAVDFLLAPERLGSFLDGRALKLFLRPTGAVLRVAGVVSAALSRIVGARMLDDLTNFFRLMSGLLDGFRQRAQEIQTLLIDPSTGFLIITAPEGEAAEEAVFLDRELARLGMRGVGLILNRIQPVDVSASDTSATEARLMSELGAGLAARVAARHAEIQSLAGRQRESSEQLRARLGEPPTSTLLDRGADVHDASGLVSLQAELLG